LKTETEAFVR